MIIFNRKITFNTDKTKFMDKRKFNAKRMNKKEFLKKLNQILKDGGQNEIKNLKHKNIEQFLDYFCETDYCREISDKEIIGTSFCFQDCYDYKGQLKFVELSNGFCFIKLFTTMGDEATSPIFNILYFNDNDKLDIYVPFCGNLVNIISKCQLSMWNGDDHDSYEILFDKYNTYLKSKYPDWAFDDYLTREIMLYDCIGKEFGIKGNLPDLSKINEDDDEIEYLYEKLNIDINLCLKDIKSNVVLV